MARPGPGSPGRAGAGLPAATAVGPAGYAARPGAPVLAQQKHHHRKAFEYISKALKLDEDGKGSASFLFYLSLPFPDFCSVLFLCR